MRAVRLGFLAWLLFALACLIPGWFLCERLAAEVQLENARPPIGREEWRTLREPGVEHLCRVLTDDPTVDRRIRAGQALGVYDGPTVWRARLRTFSDADSRVLAATFRSTAYGLRTSGLGEAFATLTDEERLTAVTHPIGPRDRGELYFHLWRTNPRIAERLTSNVFRTTSDVALAACLTRNFGGYGCFARSIDSFLPEARQGMLRAIAKGLENPNRGIRSLCEKRLGELRGQTPSR